MSTKSGQLIGYRCSALGSLEPATTIVPDSLIINESGTIVEINRYSKITDNPIDYQKCDPIDWNSSQWITVSKSVIKTLDLNNQNQIVELIINLLFESHQYKKDNIFSKIYLIKTAISLANFNEDTLELLKSKNISVFNLMVAMKNLQY